MIVGKRIGLTPDDDTRAKLIRLAIAWALELVKLCVNTPNIIEYVQRLYGADQRYRVTIRVEGGTRAVYRGGFREDAEVARTERVTSGRGATYGVHGEDGESGAINNYI